MNDHLLAALCVAFGLMLASAAVSAFDIRRLWRLNRRTVK